MTFSIFVLIALIELVRLEASAAGVNLKPSSLVDTDGSSFAKSSSDDVSPGTEIPSALAGRISYANQVEYSFALSDSRCRCTSRTGGELRNRARIAVSSLRDAAMLAVSGRQESGWRDCRNTFRKIEYSSSRMPAVKRGMGRYEA